MTILLASTIAPHKLSHLEEFVWLNRFEALRDSVDDTLTVFLAIEIDKRGLDIYEPIRERLREVDAVIWTFLIDKDPMRTEPYEVTTSDRYVRICTGRNLAIDYALAQGCSHILYLDTDVEPSKNCLPELLRMDRGLVFGHVPTYALDGQLRRDLPGDSREHWSSAGFCLVRRDVFRHVRWGIDIPDGQLSDDPCYARDARLIGRALGQDWESITRHDVVGTHHPGCVLPLEHRCVDRMLQ